MFNVAVFVGDNLARYGFGNAHPFGTDRMHAFWDYACSRGLDHQVLLCDPVTAKLSDVSQFHTNEYIKHVKKCSELGAGYIDCGDTPAIKGIYDAALTVVGTTVAAISRVMMQQSRRVFIPIAGLHHATRDSAAGFCVFNDCGVAIEKLRSQFNIRRIAYVDIDAHFGDGVFYAFESDPEIFIADIHEEGRTLYPGTGASNETGVNNAINTKLNLPVKADSNDSVFMAQWLKVEEFLIAAKPEFILFQCGADSIAGDPITHLQYTIESHRHATMSLCQLSDDLCEGRLVVMGGGGYNRTNIAHTWSAVLECLIEHS